MMHNFFAIGEGEAVWNKLEEMDCNKSIEDTQIKSSYRTRRLLWKDLFADES